jgi:hypothetical protein
MKTWDQYHYGLWTLRKLIFTTKDLAGVHKHNVVPSSALLRRFIVVVLRGEHGRCMRSENMQRDTADVCL